MPHEANEQREQNKSALAASAVERHLRQRAGAGWGIIVAWCGDPRTTEEYGPNAVPFKVVCTHEAPVSRTGLVRLDLEKNEASVQFAEGKTKRKAPRKEPALA